MSLYRRNNKDNRKLYGKTRVPGKAEPMSPRVAVSLGDPSPPRGVSTGDPFGEKVLRGWTLCLSVT